MSALALMRFFSNTQSLGPIAGTNEFLTYKARWSYHPRRLFHRDVLESRLGRFPAHGVFTKVLPDCTTGTRGMRLVKCLTGSQGVFFMPACPKTKPYRRLTLITLNYGDHAPVTAPKHGIIYRTEMKLRIIT